MVKKTMVYLEEEQHYLLHKRAKSTNKSLSRVIREAIREYLYRSNEKDSCFSFIGIAEGPEHGEVSADVDKYLREALK